MSQETGRPSPRILERLRRVRLLVLDVDGVLTDGRVTYTDAGAEIQAFCAHDGQGLEWLRRAGIPTAWISGRGSKATERRARELGVEELHLECAGPKDAVLRSLQERLGVPVEETAAMGDDLPDLALAERAAFFAAPANARPELLARADLVTRAFGGRGAVRELAELLLRAQGLAPFDAPRGADGAGA